MESFLLRLVHVVRPVLYLVEAENTTQLIDPTKNPSTRLVRNRPNERYHLIICWLCSLWGLSCRNSYQIDA